MKTKTIESIQIVGIKVRTSNLNGEAAKDIGQLWGRLMSEQFGNNIPNKVSDEIYAVYTNYEGDHLKPYDAILGYKVSSLDNLPKEMVGHTIQRGNYAEFKAKGDLTKDAIFNTWNEVFESNLDRKFSSDFELYGAKAQDPTNGEAEVYVGLN